MRDNHSIALSLPGRVVVASRAVFMNFRARPLSAPPACQPLPREPHSLPRSRTLLSSLVLASALGALAATSSGCAAPEASFDAFSERYDKIFANKPPTACPETYVPLAAGGGDGQYLMALSVALKPDEPLLFLAEVKTPATGGSVGIGWTITPLAKVDRHTPAGDSQTFEAVAIDDAGGFEIAMPGLKVSTEANTIIDVPVEADVVLTGSICGDASFVCGDITGETKSPKANLEGSTFTLIRIDDPAKYPEPLLDCEETPAKPLP